MLFDTSASTCMIGQNVRLQVIVIIYLRQWDKIADNFQK